MNYNELTKDGILEDAVFEDIIDEEDPISRADMINALLARAKELNQKGEVSRKLAAFQKAEREAKKKELPTRPKAPVDCITAFDYPKALNELRCGCWIADSQGVRTYNLFGEVLACYHPILIADRYINAWENAIRQF